VQRGSEARVTVERLRGLDAAFLYLETPTQHMHVTATMLLEPDAVAASTPAYALAEGVARTLYRRLTEQEAFRRRVVEAPLGIAHPALVGVPRVDPLDHLRSVTLPAPGTLDQLADAVGRIASVPLDRGRPLWELWTITGVDGGRLGVVIKAHHTILDGVSGVEMLGRLFTTEPDLAPSGASLEPIVEQAEPAAAELARSALLAMVRAPASVARTLLHTARAVVPLARGALEMASAAVRPAMPFSASRTLLNRALTAERAVALGTVALDTIREIKGAFGVTVNDVVLAACTRALGEYLRAHGEPPREPIVASTPVSEHVPGGARGARNRVSAMFVGLPVHLTRVADIVDTIHARSVAAKKVYAAFGPAMLADWAELAPPLLFACAAGLYSRWQLAERLPPPHSVVISNMAGPPFPLYVGTARLVAAYPLGPVLEGAGLNVSVLSYAGAVHLGLIACPRAVPEPAEIARRFERAVDELLAAARERLER
jgi:WS/DGAT/MGAT family acyltransferase